LNTPLHGLRILASLGSGAGIALEITNPTAITRLAARGPVSMQTAAAAPRNVASHLDAVGKPQSL